MDVEWAYSRYFELACAAAASGVFDVLGHPDVVKVFGARIATPAGTGCDEGRGDGHGSGCRRRCFGLDGYYDALVSAAKASGTCLEVSSAGLRQPVGEAYPAMDFLRLAYERGVSITLASDAHEPEEVGSRYGELVAWARARVIGRSPCSMGAYRGRLRWARKGGRPLWAGRFICYAPGSSVIRRSRQVSYLQSLRNAPRIGPG